HVLQAQSHALQQRHVELEAELLQKAQELQAVNQLARAAEEALADQAVVEEDLRQQNEELLVTRGYVEQEHQHYQELFALAPDGYIVTDVAGCIREANHAAIALLQVPLNFLEGKPFLVFIASAEKGKFYVRLNHLLSTRGIEEWETRVQPRRGP